MLNCLGCPVIGQVVIFCAEHILLLRECNHPGRWPHLLEKKEGNLNRLIENVCQKKWGRNGQFAGVIGL